MTSELTPRVRLQRRRARLALAAALGLGAAPACPALAWHLPWHHRAHRTHHADAAAQAPALSVRVAGQSVPAAAVPQSWQRNTLLVDLTRLPADGSATLTPPPNAGWPVRLAFRVQPGSMATLTVEGAQRVQFTLPARGAPMTLQLEPGVYVVKTPSLTLQWSAADGLPR